MYLHLGLDKVVRFEDIIGILDLDNTTVQKSTGNFLASAEKDKKVENVCTDLPKSFVVCKKDGSEKIYITQMAS